MNYESIYTFLIQLQNYLFVHYNSRLKIYQCMSILFILDIIAHGVCDYSAWYQFSLSYLQQLEDVTLFASHMTVSLRELNMSKNALQSFPHWITKSMPKLETLNLNR